MITIITNWWNIYKMNRYHSKSSLTKMPHPITATCNHTTPYTYEYFMSQQKCNSRRTRKSNFWETEDMSNLATRAKPREGDADVYVRTLERTATQTRFVSIQASHCTDVTFGMPPRSIPRRNFIVDQWKISISVVRTFNNEYMQCTGWGRIQSTRHMKLSRNIDDIFSNLLLQQHDSDHFWFQQDGATSDSTTSLVTFCKKCYCNIRIRYRHT